MMASWQQWLAKGDVKTHQISKLEINNLKALIVRDLADAGIVSFSADRRFTTAYNAAPQTGSDCHRLLRLQSQSTVWTSRSDF